MAHFAELDENNIVLRVVVISNDEILDESGRESEALGVARCRELFGENTNWVQTSYNANFRKNYACVGEPYVPEDDAFMEVKPFDSWVLNKETYRYEAPVPTPDPSEYEGSVLYWDEENKRWLDFPLAAECLTGPND